MVSLGSREVFLLLEPSLQFVDLRLRKEDARFPPLPLSGALGIFEVSFLLLQALVQGTQFCSKINGQREKGGGEGRSVCVCRNQCSINRVHRERALRPRLFPGRGPAGRRGDPLLRQRNRPCLAL